MKLFYTVLLLIGMYPLYSQKIDTPNSNFETFEKIKLGVSKNVFEKNMSILKLKKQKYFSQMIIGIGDTKTTEDYIVNCYSSNKFDFDEYNSTKQSLSHPVLIYPESIDNNTITSVTLLLGHTDKVGFVKKTDSANYNYIPQFRQDIDKDLFFKILDLYILKYGQPTMDKDTTIDVQYYLLYYNYLKKLIQNPYYNYILKWDLDYFTIEIFLGLDLNAYYIPNQGYSNSTNWLRSNLNNKPLEFNQKPCFTVPYIRYKLNSRGLKYLGLNKISL